MKRYIHSVLSIFMALLFVALILSSAASALDSVSPLPLHECGSASPAYLIKQFNVSIGPKDYVLLSNLLYLQAGSYVEFHGTYTPTTSSLKCGILTPEGEFSSIVVSGGSYGMRLRISTSGQYYLAIENTSNNSVETSGHYIY